MKRLIYLPITVCLLSLCGCTQGEYAATGAGAGALAGAAAGQIIGGHTGETLVGTALGATTGALVGIAAHNYNESKNGEPSTRGHTAYDNSEQIRNENRRKNQDDIDQARSDLRKKELEKQTLAVENERRRLLLEQKRIELEEARLQQEEARLHQQAQAN